MTIKDIYDIIDSAAPFAAQCEWDNSGLIIGDYGTEVSRIGFALDATPGVIKQAAEKSCELLVVHHPVIFHAIKSLRENDPAYLAAKYNVAVLAAHTPFDKADPGVNTVLAALLGLKGDALLSVGGDALCRAGELDSPLSEEEFAALIEEKLGSPVKYTACGNTIRKVAVCGGAGGEYVYDVRECGADAYVTGEAKHHEYLAAANAGLSLFVAGHYETENPAMYLLKNIVEEKSGAECFMLDMPNPARYTGAM